MSLLKTKAMQSELDNLVNYNREQSVSENDLFTSDRYVQLAHHLPVQHTVVVDVGCGTGRGGIVLKKLRQDMKLIGVDCVPERIEKLDRGVYSEVITGFAQNLPIQDRSVDAVLAGEFLEHVPPRYVGETLAEFFRILKLGGVLCMTTPNPGYLKNRLFKLSVLCDPAHVTQHYSWILKNRLMETGFSGVKIYGSGRVSRFLGTRGPLFIYGSYLIRAKKW